MEAQLKTILAELDPDFLLQVESTQIGGTQTGAAPVLSASLPVDSMDAPSCPEQAQPNTLN